MRKVLMFNMVSMDGFFEGPDQEIDWHVVDDEFNQYAIDQFSTVDAILFGRITYLMMASFWPSEIALEEDPVTARFMNETAKIVFSRTLDKGSVAKYPAGQGGCRDGNRQAQAAARRGYDHLRQRPAGFFTGAAGFDR